MKKTPYIILGIALLVLAVGGVAVLMNRNENSDLAATQVSSYEECVQAGFPVMESYPPQCRTSEGRTFIQNIGNELEKSDLIRIDSPRPNQTISSPLELRGQARGGWYFEASFPARLLDGNGKELAVIPVQAEGEWMTAEFVPFRATLSFSAPTTATGTLILEKDNPSGLPQNADRLIVPVKFSNSAANAPGGEQTVKIFLGRATDKGDCNEVFPVERKISRTPSVGRAALEELFKGPTAAEKQAGYFSSLNTGVKLNSLTIQNGVARADFGPELDRAVGGSCRVSAIRAQITQTLKQFPTVREVIISINGRTEDILQP